MLPRKGGGDLQLSAGHLERSKLDVVWQEGWPWSAPGKVSLTSLNLIGFIMKIGCKNATSNAYSCKDSPQISRSIRVLVC